MNFYLWTSINWWYCIIAITLAILRAPVVYQFDTTRSTQRAQTSLAKADHYSHMKPHFVVEVMNVETMWWKANPKGSESLPAPWSDLSTANMVFCAHLLILEDIDHHQNLINSL